MTIENCRQCQQPFDRVGVSPLCFHCLKEERRQYHRLYKILGSIVYRLNFFIIADKTRHNPHHLKEVLLNRLGRGEVPELPDAKKGVCYLCQARLLNRENPEPLCLPCLEKITAVVDQEQNNRISEEDLAQEALDFSPQKTDASLDSTISGVGSAEPRQESMPAGANQCLLCGDASKEEICKRCIQQSVLEIQWYRQQYGMIPPEEKGKIKAALTLKEEENKPTLKASQNVLKDTETGTPDISPNVLPSSDFSSATHESTDLFLKILEVDDMDPELVQEILSDSAGNSSFLDLSKKYGFKRLKFQ